MSTRNQIREKILKMACKEGQVRLSREVFNLAFPELCGAFPFRRNGDSFEPHFPLARFADNNRMDVAPAKDALHEVVFTLRK